MKCVRRSSLSLSWKGTFGDGVGTGGCCKLSAFLEHVLADEGLESVWVTSSPKGWNELLVESFDFDAFKYDQELLGADGAAEAGLDDFPMMTRRIGAGDWGILMREVGKITRRLQRYWSENDTAWYGGQKM